MRMKLAILGGISALFVAAWVALLPGGADEDGRRLGDAPSCLTTEREARRADDRSGNGASVESSPSAAVEDEEAVASSPEIEEDDGPRFRGRVVDAVGEPVAGAAVSLHVWDVEKGRTRSSWGEDETISGADGVFELKIGSSDEPLVVVASDAQRGSGASAILPEPPTADRDVGEIVLLERAALAGRIEFAGGSPFPWARVVVSRWRDDAEDEGTPTPSVRGALFRGAPWIETTADADGRFRVLGCEPGCRYRVMVSQLDDCAAEFPTAPDEDVVVGIEMRRLEVRVAVLGLESPEHKVNVLLRSRKGSARVFERSLEVLAPASAFFPLPETDASIVVGYGDDPSSFGRTSFSPEANQGDIVVDLVVAPAGPARRLIFTDARDSAIAERLRVEASDIETDYPLMIESIEAGILEHHLPAGRWRFTVRPVVFDHRAPTTVDVDVPASGEARVGLKFEIGGRIALQIDRSRALLETSPPFKYGVAAVGPDGIERLETFLKDYGDFLGQASDLWVDSPYKSARVFAPGRYGLRIRTASGTLVERSVEVRRGETTPVRFEIESDPGANYRFCGGTAH